MSRGITAAGSYGKLCSISSAADSCASPALADSRRCPGGACLNSPCVDRHTMGVSLRNDTLLVMPPGSGVTWLTNCAVAVAGAAALLMASLTEAPLGPGVTKLTKPSTLDGGVEAQREQGRRHVAHNLGKGRTAGVHTCTFGEEAWGGMRRSCVTNCVAFR
eukprot:362322-Chlamydomonas_euryale.AAC.1